MKSAIIYYSYSGNTKKVATVLSEYLKQKGQVIEIELVALDESKSFLGQCYRAFSRTRAQIQPVVLDLSDYDLICLGSPVWAFSPSPAMKAYLDKCFGVENKEIILFTTYGSGIGNQRCLKYMQDILTQKGAKNFKRFSIQQFKVGDRNFVISAIKEVLQF